MCGIAGLCGFGTGTKENIEIMKSRMFHRGPDGEGTWISGDGRVGLGHRRLSILDLSEAAAQPMISRSGKKVMVFNGEIYNFHEIAAKLKEEKNFSFRTTGDTEVLLEAIEAYGMKEALSMTRGMFGIAVFDTQTGDVQLARDRVGEKPLYYGTVHRDGLPDAFAFASDVGCIAALSGFANKINTSVLRLYFTHGYIPAPYSIYEDVFKLQPGTILTIHAPYSEKITPQTAETQTYWSMKETAVRGQRNLFTGSRQEAADELERLLLKSVKGQMISDVPLGAFLSAGIDSSTVVSLMQAAGASRVRSFTIGMDEKGFDEAKDAKEIAGVLGTEHTELYITEEDAKAVIPLLARMFSEPFADSSQIPTYLVSRMTREHVTVSLSGDGGDELFGGYNSYRSVERVWGKMRKIPAFVRKPVGTVLLHTPLAKNEVYRDKAGYLKAASPEEVYRQSYEQDPLIRKIAGDPGNISYAYTQLGPDETGEVTHDIMLMDLSMYHPDDILVKVDRTAMAVSLETRVPMLDKDVVEFAWTLPTDFLVDPDKGIGKLVLRDVLFRRVPKELMERPKKGFGIPIAKWLKEPELRAWAEDLLDEKTLREQGLLDPEVVRGIWEDFTGRGIYRVQIWYILMFQAWYREEYQNRHTGAAL